MNDDDTLVADRGGFNDVAVADVECDVRDVVRQLIRVSVGIKHEIARFQLIQRDSLADRRLCTRRTWQLDAMSIEDILNESGTVEPRLWAHPTPVVM